MRRFKHSLSHYLLSTFDMGELVPVGHFEVLPGDSVRMSTSCLLRVSPLLTPVMHPVSVRIHHWFVPYRLLFDEWEQFITGGSDGSGDGAVLPTINADAVDALGGLGNYFGIPQNVNAAIDVLAWPWRAYNMIFNENYRDQDLVTAVSEDSNVVQKVAWEKDYFTAARPWTQKGPEVVLPLGSEAPVESTGDGAPIFNRPGGIAGLAAGGANTSVVLTAAASGAGGLSWNDPKLVADLSTATAASVNEIRLAFALQRYAEARAQFGSRYTEYLRYLGVRSSDARLDRPEYLGGGRSTISFSEVLKTGEGDTPDADAPIGEMRGHGISAMRTRRFIRFFEEHGIVMSLASIRPKSMYMDGIHRSFLRVNKEDYWQRELEQIGQQEITNRELYADSGQPNAAFGYQDRYSEYRHHPSYVTGQFQTTMNDWHLGRSFSSTPTLNGTFVTCEPSKRIHAEQTTDVIWGMFSHSIQARRMVGHRTIGRIF